MPVTAEPNEAERRAARRIGAIVGKYRIESVLGVGGMASVYLAVHRNGHKVALKMLHPEISADPDLRARFVREGYAANSIEHRGVVRVLDDDEADDGSVFLVMDLLHGETLTSLARRAGGKLPARTVLSLAHQLLDVVAAAHARGVVHRDIKPDNLFVTDEGVLKVLDFGIARARFAASGSDPTHTGRAMGTPAFMAPEQAIGRARDVDERTDVFACGATMFTCLSGRLVHEAESVQEQLVFAATRPVRSLATVEPELPAVLIGLVDRATAFERADRYPSATAMRAAVAAVHEALYGEKVKPPSPSLAPGPRSEIESAPTMDARGLLPGADPNAAGGEPRAPGTDPRLPGVTPPPVVVLREKPRRWVLVAGLGAAALFVGAALVGRGSSSSPQHPVPSASAPATPPCTNASCAVGGKAAVCRRGACVPLESVDCTVMARPEDLADESTIWVGSMFPTHPPLGPDFVESVRSVDLARRDFLEVSNGLPSPRPGAPPRPIAVVQCDDGVDPPRAARHLVDDVGVPAIIGFARSKEVVDLALSLFNPRGVMALAANTAPMLSSIPGAPGQPRMVWRVTYSSPMLAGAMAAVVRRVEPQLRASHALAAAEPMRVLLVRVTNATGIGVSDSVVATLRYNGKTVAENGERGFREVAIPDLTELHGASASARVLAEIAAFHPHVVLDTAGGASLVAEIEAAWPAGGLARPVYVLQGTLSEPEYAQAIAHDAALARRLFGVDTATESAPATKYVLRHNEAFQPPINALEANDAPYDAFYAFAYLAAALGDAPIDGPSLARAIPHIVGGKPVDVGPAGIYAALAALGRGESLDLHGAATSLDFDPATGDASTRFAAFTFCPDAAGKLRPAEAAFTWESHAAEAAGELRCP